MGRPVNELITHYSNLVKSSLSEYNTATENIYTSKITDLTLCEYCKVRRFICMNKHKNCIEYNSMIHAAKLVIEEGIVTLKHVFTSTFPSVTYHANNAKRHLLQMPLVAIRLQSSKEDPGKLYLMEKVDGLDYEKLVKFLNSQMTQSSKQGILKDDLRKLMLIAQSERERENASVMRFTNHLVLLLQKHIESMDLTEWERKQYRWKPV